MDTYYVTFLNTNRTYTAEVLGDDMVRITWGDGFWHCRLPLQVMQDIVGGLT